MIYEIWIVIEEKHGFFFFEAGSCCVAQAGLELTILIPPKC
jgi:hypothetical protein